MHAVHNLDAYPGQTVNSHCITVVVLNLGKIVMLLQVNKCHHSRAFAGVRGVRESKLPWK